MIVLKVGGNAIWPRASSGIDYEFTQGVFEFVTSLILKQQEKVVLFPGGVGGQHFITWARDAGCSEEEMNQIGCNLINTAAAILNRYFLGKSPGLFAACPTVALTLSDLDMYCSSYNLVVSGVSIHGAVSSDSLAAMAAEHLKGTLLMIKKSYPYEADHIEFVHEEPRTLSLKKISEYINEKDPTFRAGHHSSIDQVCLRVLERSKLQARILSKKDLMKWCAGGKLNMLQIDP